MKCHKCNSEIPSNQVNIATDLAHCKGCNTIQKISEVSQANESFDLKKNPKGTWFEKKSSNELLIGASTASPIAFFLIPFMLIWSGASLGGIYGTQIISGEFNLFLSLFGIPFLLGTFFFGAITIMSVAGKVEIIITKAGGVIFTGVGNIGFSKKFTWNEISSIKETHSYSGNRPGRIGNRGTKISIEGERRVSFGTGIPNARKYYMLESLKKLHYNIKNNNSLLI
tara:strand:- start:19856 stop:20533 length:678 start_codon:yes stop_codon:yes gene_type:complete